MKRIYFIFITSMLFVACESVLTKHDKIHASIENKFLELGFDESRFEIVEMTISKTFTVNERRNIIDLDHLKGLEVVVDHFPDLLKQARMEYNFLEGQNNGSKEATYYVDFLARVKDGSGKTDLKNYSAIILNDDKYSIVNIRGIDQ